MGRSVYRLRLPTEAEWEVAARAATAARYAGTDDAGEICLYGNVADATAKKANPAWATFECDDKYEGIAPARSFQPNGFRLYDMTGNVREWVWDWYGAYGRDSTDPRGPESGQFRVFRGGSFVAYPRVARVAYRGNVVPSWADPAPRVSRGEVITLIPFTLLPFDSSRTTLRGPAAEGPARPLRSQLSRRLKKRPRSALLDRGRKDRLSRSPLPPNRTCGSPAYGSPVGGFTCDRTDGPAHGLAGERKAPARQRNGWASVGDRLPDHALYVRIAFAADYGV